MAYKKGDPEYRSNGHYVIEGEDWMSIWTYKNKMGLGNNSTPVNGSEAKELLSMGKQTNNSVPDFGSFGNILLFKETDLNAYYD
jgi:hypothetical protein